MELKTHYEDSQAYHVITRYTTPTYLPSPLLPNGVQPFPLEIMENLSGLGSQCTFRVLVNNFPGID